jgi:GNAT superfamily N-acetyltransferase
MTENDINIAIQWAKQEGWNPGINDAKTFYNSDPKAFFIGKIGDKPIAVASATIYDDHYAFFGFLMVKKEFRGQGYGLAITQHRLKYIGNRNAGLDGVVQMQQKYSRNGFKLYHRNIRYELAKYQTKEANKQVIDISDIDFKKLLKFDSLYFPAKREKFLSLWIKQKNSYALAYVDDNNEINGYAVMRKCHIGYKIGPLFAKTSHVAESLFETMLINADGEIVYLDIPQTNLNALALVKKYNMNMVFETGRMYLHNQPQLPIDEIYGITSFEFG